MVGCDKSGEDYICVRYGCGIAVFWRFGGRSCGVGWFWWDRRGKIVVCEILGVECDVFGHLLQFWVAGCRKYGGF